MKNQLIKSSYLLFLGNVQGARLIKTAIGILYRVPEKYLRQLRPPNCRANQVLPGLDVETAIRKGVKTLIVRTSTHRINVLLHFFNRNILGTRNISVLVSS